MRECQRSLAARYPEPVCPSRPEQQALCICLRSTAVSAPPLRQSPHLGLRQARDTARAVLPNLVLLFSLHSPHLTRLPMRFRDVLLFRGWRSHRCAGWGPAKPAPCGLYISPSLVLEVWVSDMGGWFHASLRSFHHFLHLVRATTNRSLPLLGNGHQRCPQGVNVALVDE